MAENRVELIVDARAAAADAEVDLLKKKLNDLGRMVETAKIKVEGAAKALADVLAVEASMDRLNKKGPGILSRLGSSFVSLGTQAGGRASSIGLNLVPNGALVAIISGPLLAS